MKYNIPVNARMPAVVILVFAAFLTGVTGCGGKEEKVESLTVGMEATAVNSLIYIAENQKYFQANGLNITIRDNYPSGAAAAEGMLKGEVDVSTAAELAIVRQAFARESIVTLASIDRFMHMKLIGRKDRAILDIPDLKGKKIGVPVKTAADFNLGRFLDLNGIKVNQVTVVDVQAPKAVDSLINGEVDAVVAWQPNVQAIEDRLAGGASIWSVHNGQPIYCAVVTTGNMATSRPNLIKRFLNSLGQAEDYLVRNPDQARDIVQKRLGYDDRYIRNIWPEHEFSLRLDQALILAMEDQARWMINNNLTTEKTVPNFLDYINVDGVKAVKPGAVNIIR